MMDETTRQRAEAIRSGQVSREELRRLVMADDRNRCIYWDSFFDRVETLVFEERGTLLASLTRIALEFLRDLTPKDRDRETRAWALVSAAKLLEGDVDKAQRYLVEHALKKLSPDSPQSPSVWARLAAVRAEQGELENALGLMAKAVDFLPESESPETGSSDGSSMASLVLQTGLIKRRKGRSTPEIAREFLMALELSTRSTPRTRDAAARHLALHCGKAWLEGDSRILPGPLLEGTQRVRRRLELERGLGGSLCYARLLWVEGMALCVLSQSLTKIAYNKFQSAKVNLTRMNDARDLISLNMDLSFWLLKENRWWNLSAVVDELLDLCVVENRPDVDVGALRLWKCGVEKREVDHELTTKVFRRLREVRKLADLDPRGGYPEGLDARPSPYGW